MKQIGQLTEQELKEYNSGNKDIVKKYLEEENDNANTIANLRKGIELLKKARVAKSYALKNYDDPKDKERMRKDIETIDQRMEQAREAIKKYSQK